MYILTGGAGFIGSCLLATLNAQGISDVLVVDDLGSSEKWKNLSNKSLSDYLHKDQLLERISSGTMPEKVQGVIHLGACSSTTETNAEYMMRNNYQFSKVLAEWALHRGIRFIYASSAATYGDGENGFADNEAELSKLRPLNVYALSKQLFDKWAVESGAIKKCVGLKFFNVYGPNEYHKGEMRSVVQKSFEQIKEKGSVSLFKSHHPNYKDGEQLRDFVYVKDCAEVICWLLENQSVAGLYNLGTGSARHWKDLVSAVFVAMGKNPKIKFIDMPEHLRGKYQYFTQAEMNKLSDAGYTKSFTSLEEGVKDYVQNYLLEEYPYF